MSRQNRGISIVSGRAIFVVLSAKMQKLRPSNGAFLLQRNLSVAGLKGDGCLGSDVKPTSPDVT